ncbi:MAG: hypothetical protein E6Q98_09795 [Rhodospirillaceae bacterium]|nr:MAG: hypothetical protein E6Q98_09795 [Rhodospirillaceae bacterium]
MTTPKAILAGFALIAVSILVVGLADRPFAASSGGYQITTAAPGEAWKVNTQTGKLYHCPVNEKATCTEFHER